MSEALTALLWAAAGIAWAILALAVLGAVYLVVAAVMAVRDK